MLRGSSKWQVLEPEHRALAPIAIEPLSCFDTLHADDNLRR